MARLPQTAIAGDEPRNATYGYARVSRARDDGSNTLENQRRVLNEYGVDHIYEDIITGVAASRPGLNEMLERLNSGDTVVVVAMDRLGRDTLQVTNLLSDFAQRNVNLRVLNLPGDIQDIRGGGRLIGLIAAEIAAIERARISERTIRGLERAREEGKYLGRRWSISRGQMRSIHRLADNGLSVAAITQTVAVPETTVRRVLKIDPESIPDEAFKKGMA